MVDKLSSIIRDQLGNAEIVLLMLIVVVGLAAVTATITFTAQAPAMRPATRGERRLPHGQPAARQQTSDSASH